MSPSADLDAHEQPSEQMKAEWKHFSRLDQDVLLQQTPLDDPRRPLEESGFHLAGHIPRSQISQAFSHLRPDFAAEAGDDAPIIYHPLLPGMLSHFNFHIKIIHSLILTY